MYPLINRRRFAAAGIISIGHAAHFHADGSPDRTSRPPHPLPRWRGFNLVEKFSARPDGNPAYRKSDITLINEWGFDFVRLPLSYLCWSSHADPYEVRETELKHVDDALAWAGELGIHVCLNLHRAPGYCVNPPPEPFDLWKDPRALDACVFHWVMLAKRFRGIPSQALSFNLLNEPGDLPEDVYARVVRALTAAVRAEDPSRLILVDGLRWGQKPVSSLAGLGVAQSTRGYTPSELTFYKVKSYKGSDQWPLPTWPLTRPDGQVIDVAYLREQRIAPWKKLAEQGVGVHVGEWGVHNRTPHAVTLAWMADQLALWKEAGWGWALWNLRGTFGVLDSGRTDVSYERLGNDRLDRDMLKLLQTG